MEENTIFTTETYGEGSKKKYKVLFIKSGEYRINKIGGFSSEEKAKERIQEAFPGSRYLVALDFHHIHRARIRKLIPAPTSMEELEHYLLIKKWSVCVRQTIFTLDKTSEGYSVGEYREIPMVYPKLNDAVIALLHEIGFWEDK